MADTRLFKPLKIGNVEIKHRIGMAPLTRFRANSDRVPVPLMQEYYSQRASVPGTLIITEGTAVSPSACGGWPNTPGIWTAEQIAAWRTITDEVHRKGSFIFCQIFAMGRSGDTDTAQKEGIDIIGPSAIPIAADAPVPRPMSIGEIKQMVQDFVTAAKNAMEAGFDGVECHGGNGYLVDQFLQDVSNTRQDEYGGSVKNRSRFMHEIMSGVVDAIGPERVGLRLSPWSPFNGMKMEDPVPQFSDIIAKADRLNMAYLHLIESRVAGAGDHTGGESLGFAYKLWNRPFLIAGGYSMANAQKLVDEEYPDKDVVVVFGRYFISNPDLVYRIKQGLQLSKYERQTFYSSSSEGYTDYPFSAEYLASQMP